VQLKQKRFQPRWSLVATLASAAAFQVPMSTISPTVRPRATNVMPLRLSARRTYGLRPRRNTLTMAGTNTLSRTIEEEERRIGLWKGRFGLTDDQVSALRESFQVYCMSPCIVRLTSANGIACSRLIFQCEQAVYETEGTDTRTLPKQKMKLVIEQTQVKVDAVDVGNDGRPVVTQDELQAYVDALGPMWAETCDTDAVEVANGECQVPLDPDNFDLSETLAIFGMCLREHCGIGGVCFWDTPSTPETGGKW